MNRASRRRDDKVRICKRAYDLLVKKVGFPPEDIIFDPNILTVGDRHRGAQQLRGRLHQRGRADQTGMPRRQNQRRGQQHQLQLPRQRPCPRSDAQRVPVSRRQAGLDMGIVNAGQLEVYEEIPKDLLERVEDVLLNRRPTRPTACWSSPKRSRRKGTKKAGEDLAWRESPVCRRTLKHALIKGYRQVHREDTEEARQQVDAAWM
jgi:5-methyltetrahydrofolate--homocysteine methyltransferase